MELHAQNIIDSLYVGF